MDKFDIDYYEYDHWKLEDVLDASFFSMEEEMPELEEDESHYEVWESGYRPLSEF